MEKITITELLTNWWDTHLTSREKLDSLDWDQLLDVMNVEIEDYEGLKPIVVDHDNDGWTILVAFGVEK
jgi:hypothetical protein